MVLQLTLQFLYMESQFLQLLVVGNWRCWRSQYFCSRMLRICCVICGGAYAVSPQFYQLPGLTVTRCLQRGHQFLQIPRATASWQALEVADSLWDVAIDDYCWTTAFEGRR